MNKKQEVLNSKLRWLRMAEMESQHDVAAAHAADLQAMIADMGQWPTSEERWAVVATLGRYAPAR